MAGLQLEAGAWQCMYWRLGVSGGCLHATDHMQAPSLDVNRHMPVSQRVQKTDFTVPRFRPGNIGICAGPTTTGQNTKTPHPRDRQ